MLAREMSTRLQAMGKVMRLKRVRASILELEAEERMILTQLVGDLGLPIGSSKTYGDLDLWLKFPGVEYSLDSRKYKDVARQLGVSWDPIIATEYTQYKVNKELYQICKEDAPSEIMALLDSCISPRYPDIKYEIIHTKN